MEIMIFCGIYLVELVCYLIVMRMLFDSRLGKKVWILAGIIMPISIGIFIPIIMRVLPVNAEGKNVLITVNVIIVLFFSIEESFSEKGVKILLAFLLLECLDGIFADPCNLLVSFLSNSYLKNIEYLFLKCCITISVLLLSTLKQKFSIYLKTHINSIIYLIISMIAISMIFCLNILDQVKIFLPNTHFQDICNILNVTILINIFLLVIFVIYIKNTHERVEQLLKTERLLKESQVYYYKQILKKEIDTRKYRHDMMNHLLYIHDILSRKKLDAAQNYLDSILGGFKKIQKTYFVTGNEMVDTIMNYFLGIISKSVKIDICGKCPVEFDMEDTEVCTVFSNIFQNAVEEITENNLKDAFIKVCVRKGKHYVEYDKINVIMVLEW